MTWGLNPMGSGPGPKTLHNKVGSSAAPVDSLAGAIAANTLFGDGSNDIVIPYESLYPGWRAVIDVCFEHAGTAGSVSNTMLKGNVNTRNASGTTLCNVNPSSTDGSGGHMRTFLAWNGTSLQITVNSAGMTAPNDVKADVALTAGQSYVIAAAVTTVAAGDTVKLIWLAMDRTA